jgi:protein required for attachment to host cells
MKLPNNTLVLIADGRKMLFLRNHGDTAQLDLRIEAHREQDNPPNRDQVSDAPGRVFASVGSSRSAMEETDYHQIAEDRFAAEAADLLRGRALGGDFETLVVVAPPRTLGELRKHYHKAVASRIVEEINKDLTGRSVNEIEAALTHHIGTAPLQS